MAGVTKPALYYHFQSKEGIYVAIIEDLVRIADEARARVHDRAGLHASSA